MKKILGLILIAGLIYSCNVEKRSARKCAKCPSKDAVVIRDSIIQIVKDTAFIFDSDTATFMALIECNEKGEALLKQIENYSTSGVKTVVVYKDRVLRITTTVDSVTIGKSWVEKYKSQNKAEVKIITKEVKYIPWYYWVILTLCVSFAWFHRIIFKLIFK